jgi:dGTPase
LRIVDILERPYPSFLGLNLSLETRESILKHGVDKAGALGAEFPRCRQPWLEAQLVDLADSLAYYAHDVDDGLRFGVFDPEELEHLELWQQAREAARRTYPDAGAGRLLRATLQQILKLPIADLLAQSSRRLEASGITEADQARDHEQRLIRFSPDMQQMHTQLRAFLFERFYRADSVEETRRRGRDQLRDLFHYYMNDPDEMAPWARQRQRDGEEPEGLPRVVCDYIAGMTDRFAIQDHAHRHLG